jgi:hypothetical protein
MRLPPHFPLWLWRAPTGRSGGSRRWVPTLALALAALVTGAALGRALWPGPAETRVVRGTITAVNIDRTLIGFMPDGHRDPDPPPSLRERLDDWRYGGRNTFAGYEVGGVLWADAEGAWHGGTQPDCLAPPGTNNQRVELGLVWARAGSDGAAGGPLVVWLRCL